MRFTLLLNLFKKNIYKYIYKIFSHQNKKHNRRFWPYYSIKRSQQGFLEKIYFKKKIVADNTRSLKISNTRCMLITTGPSIKEMDRSFFEKNDLDYIGVNGAIELRNINFKAYIIIDHDFVLNRFDLVEKVLKSSCIFFTVPRCLDIIISKVNICDIRCEIKVIEKITDNKIEVLLGEVIENNINKKHFYIYENFGFSSQIFDAIFDYHTVAYAALQIIYYLKYQTIYIAGLDMNNFQNPRFYESIDNKQPSHLDQNLDAIIHAFNTASHFFQAHNISVYNLSKDSLIESFPKIEKKSI